MPRVPEEYLEARRAEILRAAAACFSERGYRATHMRDVASRAQLSTGAVYRYFAGKEQLFKAMMEWERPAEQALEIALLEGATPIERLQGLVEKMARLAADSEARAQRNFRDYGEAAEVPFLAKELGRAVTEILDAVEGVVRDAQREGEIDGDLEPRAIAAVLSTQIVSLRFTHLFGGQYDPEAVAETLRRLLEGLKPRT